MWVIISTVASLSLAIIALVTLYWQYYSNKRQKFENHFFELLKIHSQNVDEMKIGLLVGRQIFKEMFYELRNCQGFINKVFDELTGKESNDSFANPNDMEKKKNADFYASLDCFKRNSFAYQLFFQGIEFNHIFKVIYPDKSILQSEKNVIEEKLKEQFLKQYDNWQQGNSSIAEVKITENNLQISYYKPYCGRSEWLGHYFRHLFQTVKFIDKACLCKKAKYEYIKTLKAQLSEYEQAILFYHACSNLGAEWFDGGKKSFIVKYRLIQHLPLLMLFDDECKDLNDKLYQILSEKEIEKYFEIEQ